jgi:hypothetical protein
MAITTLNGWIAAAKQRLLWQKTTTRTTVAGGWFSMFDVAGFPGAGTLAGANTANGVVPVAGQAGYPSIVAFGGGTTGYLGRTFGSSSVSSRIRFYDRLFVAGAYAFNANTNLASQPSYSGRLPTGPDYTSLEIWVENVTASTGNQAVSVNYTNQAGTTGRTTGAVGIGAAPTVGRCWQLPLQSGDSGVQKIENVTGSVATVGTFNVMILRPLIDLWVSVASEGRIYDFLSSGMVQVFDTSAVFPLIQAPSGTSSGLPMCEMDFVSG